MVAVVPWLPPLCAEPEPAGGGAGVGGGGPGAGVGGGGPGAVGGGVVDPADPPECGPGGGGVGFAGAQALVATFRAPFAERSPVIATASTATR